jgi:hypothetical protein
MVSSHSVKGCAFSKVSGKMYGHSHYFSSSTNSLTNDMFLLENCFFSVTYPTLQGVHTVLPCHCIQGHSYFFGEQNVEFTIFAKDVTKLVEKSVSGSNK